jgi:tRNA (uracil-5-)-methyltransferase TRM9
MDQATVQKLAEMNTIFYTKHGESFDTSRSQPWQGWQLLEKTFVQLLNKNELNVLDLGCGNGRFFSFLNELITANHSSALLKYHGIDSNTFLLEQAAKKLTQTEHRLQNIDIVNALQQNTLIEKLNRQQYDLIVGFGLLHHIPSQELRGAFLQQLLACAKANGTTILSFWQFAEKMTKNTTTIDPTLFSLKKEQLEYGDFLLGWHNDTKSPRYCHSFSTEEAAELVKQAGWKMHQSLLADGKNNSTNLYLVLSPEQR